MSNKRIAETAKRLRGKLLNRSNSALECRLCLMPGLERRCCGNYYCNLCYYKFSTCQSCNAPVELSDQGPTLQNATPWERKWTFCLVVGIPVGAILIGMIVAAFFVSLPKTNFGFQCTNHFDRKFTCVAYDSYINNGGAVARVEDWVKCNITDPNYDRPLFCACGDMCPVQDCVHKNSKGEGARDFVASRFWATRMTFADSFEAPTLNTSMWDARSLVLSKACGSAQGTFAARFFGRSTVDRYLATRPLDVSSGGLWEFALKYADGVGDGCEAVQSALVAFQYSLSSSGPWVTIATYARKSYIGSFHGIRVEIPKGAWSRSTRFRWNQDFFFDQQEVWMVDNVKLFSHFPSDWKSSARWKLFKERAKSELKMSECCYECHSCKNPGSANKETCASRPHIQLSTFLSSRNFAIEHEYLLVVAGLVALLGVVIRVSKIVYRSAMSGVFVCCRPCVRCMVRRRIRNEHNEKVRKKAQEKQLQLERERQRKDEEDAVAERIERERTKHLAAPANRREVALPAHLVPDEETAKAMNLVAMPERRPEDELSTDNDSEAQAKEAAATQSYDDSPVEEAETKGDDIQSGSDGSANSRSQIRRNDALFKTRHHDLRIKRAEDRATAELEQRKADRIARKQALLELDAEAIAADAARTALSTSQFGSYAAVDADEKEERERVERVKAALSGGIPLRSLYADPVIPWNESRPVYEPTEELDEEYRKGGEALAVKFYTTVPQRRRTADFVEEHLVKDIEHESKAGVPQQKRPRRTRREPSSRALPLESVQVPSHARAAAEASAATAPPVAVAAEPSHASMSDYSFFSDDDSEFGSDEDGEMVTDSEDDDQLEVDVNEIMRRDPRKATKPDDETPGYLPQLFTADERNRTDVYKPRRSVVWSIFYLAAGVAGPLFLGLALLLNYGGTVIGQNTETVLFRLGIANIKLPYILITACAIITDAYVILRIALDVVGITPLTIPSFRLIWAEPKEDEDFSQFVKKSAFVIDGGVAGKRIRVPLSHVRGSTFAKQYEPHAIAGSFLFVSLPWACLSIVLSYRYLNLVVSAFSFCRVLYGPWFLVKFAMVMYELSSTVYVRTTEQRDRFAAACCGYRARLGAWLMCFCFGPIFFLITSGFLCLIVMQYNTSTTKLRKDTPVLAPVLYLLVLTVPYMVGWVLGCSHNLPVQPILFLTNLGQGVRVSFLLPRKSELFESYRFFAGNPARVAGTGIFATFIDGIASTLGFMPRNASHFVLDPFPTQEAVCFVFGTNNINDFKRSLSRDDMLARMERAHKILRGVAVEGVQELGEDGLPAIGAKFRQPPPSSVVKKAGKPQRRRRRRRAAEVEDAADAAATSDTVVIVGGEGVSDKKRRRRRIVKAVEPAPSGNPLTEYAKRRQRAKGGGRLPHQAKVAKKYRAGRRKHGQAAAGESDEGSTASDGNVDVVPDRAEMLSPSKRFAMVPSHSAAQAPAAATRQSGARIVPSESAMVLSHLDDDVSDPDDKYTRMASAGAGESGPGSVTGTVRGDQSTIGGAMTPLISVASLGVPVFDGSFVEADPDFDSPGVSPQLQKAMKYSKAVLLGASPSLHHNPNLVSSLSFQRHPSTSPTKTMVAETREEREARLAARAGGRIDPEKAAQFAAQRESKTAAKRAVDSTVVEQAHERRVAERRADSDRKLRSGLSAGLAQGIVASPPPVREEDTGVLTPFKIVEAKKAGVDDPLKWGLTSPPSLRLQSRRNAV